MTLHDALLAARSALGQGDFAAAETAARKALDLSGIHERTALEWWNARRGACPEFREFLRRVLYLGAAGDHSYRDFLGQDGLDVASDRARKLHDFVYGKV